MKCSCVVLLLLQVLLWNLEDEMESLLAGGSGGSAGKLKAPTLTGGVDVIYKRHTRRNVLSAYHAIMSHVSWVVEIFFAFLDSFTRSSSDVTQTQCDHVLRCGQSIDSYRAPAL